jgi:CDP-glycerol glycerophosphotransferase
MTNPLPIVKACDGFILASHYEGIGLVLVEADILGLPVVSTDITGPRTFMQNNNGTLVPNTFEGVEEGFRLLIDGKVPMLTSDYKKYNENALEEFKKIV